MFVLLASGLLFQGCSLQKRSLMSGWHVERIGLAPAYSKALNLQPVGDIANETPVSRGVTERTHLDSLIPVKALMRFTPPKELTTEPIMPRYAEQAKLHDPQALGEVASNSGVEPPQPPGEEMDKKRKKKLSAIAALLGIGAVFAFKQSEEVIWRPTARRLKWLGGGLIALALVFLRFAFRFEDPELPQERPIQQELPVQEDSLAKRIAMGVLGGVLGISSIPAFSFGFFDPSLWPFLLGGVGLAYLSLRAFFVTFPNALPRLRARLTNPDKAEARTRKQQEPGRADEPNRNWLWLLALIPVVLLILAVSSFSFPTFGM